MITGSCTELVSKIKNKHAKEDRQYYAHSLYNQPSYAFRLKRKNTTVTKSASDNKVLVAEFLGVGTRLPLRRQFL